MRFPTCLTSAAASLVLCQGAFAQFSSENVVFDTTSSGFIAYVTAADLDGDGDVDLVSTRFGSNRVQWYANDGAGSFGAPQLIDGGLSGPRDSAAGDFDGDGDMDLVVASDGAETIVGYENLGGGVFGPATLIDSQIDSVVGLKLADLDGDGDLDVFAGFFEFGSLSWFENLGGGQFDAEAVIATTLTLSGVDVADLDGDGDLDLIGAIDSNSQSICTVENLGTGTFDAIQLFNAVSSNALDVSPSDVDGDGDIDLLAVHGGSAGLQWHENQGGSFDVAHAISVGVSSAWRIDPADLDGDGDEDVVTIRSGANELAWHENLGGVFGPAQVIATDLEDLWGAALADLDGDGAPDVSVAIAELGAGRISWFQNRIARFEPFCAGAVLNSTGSSAELTAVGSDFLADGDIELVASQLPPSSATVFFASRSEGFLPAARGSAGILCLTGRIGRFLDAGQVQEADAQGQVRLTIDASALPTSSGFLAADVGDRWSFQCWYRDEQNGRAESNFTTGIAVTFR